MQVQSKHCSLRTFLLCGYRVARVLAVGRISMKGQQDCWVALLKCDGSCYHKGGRGNEGRAKITGAESKRKAECRSTVGVSVGTRALAGCSSSLSVLLAMWEVWRISVGCH